MPAQGPGRLHILLDRAQKLRGRLAAATEELRLAQEELAHLSTEMEEELRQSLSAPPPGLLLPMPNGSQMLFPIEKPVPAHEFMEVMAEAAKRVASLIAPEKPAVAGPTIGDRIEKVMEASPDEVFDARTLGMSLPEIDLQVIRVTLARLVGQGRIQRVGAGQYKASAIKAALQRLVAARNTGGGTTMDP